MLDYSLLQRRRELGIRIAIGAPARDIVWCATLDGLAMVFAGAVTGLALALLSMRYIASLVYEVKATDPAPLIFPALILFAAALPLRCCVQNRGDSPVSSHTDWRGNSTGPEMTARTAFSRVAGVNGFAKHGASVPG